MLIRLTWLYLFKEMYLLRVLHECFLSHAENFKIRSENQTVCAEQFKHCELVVFKLGTFFCRFWSHRNVYNIDFVTNFYASSMQEKLNSLRYFLKFSSLFSALFFLSFFIGKYKLSQFSPSYFFFVKPHASEWGGVQLCIQKTHVDYWGFWRLMKD